jgi:uncharacterized protein (TIGR02246 family)
MIRRDVEPEVAESKLQSLLQRVLDAWEHGDGRALAAAFAEDGDLIFFDGACLRGRSQIEAVTQHLFDTAWKGTRCLAQIKTVRFVAPEVVLMQTLGGVVFPGETKVPVERCAIQTLVAVRTRGIWRIASLQNTRMQAAGLGSQGLAEELSRLAHRGISPARGDAFNGRGHGEKR